MSQADGSKKYIQQTAAQHAQGVHHTPGLRSETQECGCGEEGGAGGRRHHLPALPLTGESSSLSLFCHLPTEVTVAATS